MKKTFSLILAAALVLTLTACNNSEESSDSSNKSSVPEAVSTVSTVEEPVSSAAPEISEPEDDPIIVPDDPNNPADPDEPTVDNSGLEYPDNRAGRMVKAAVGTGEWGYLMSLDVEMITTNVPGLNADDFEECCGVMAMMSAVANEVYCIKPKDEKTDAVKSALNNLVQTKKDDPMQYPMVQEVWSNAVVDEDGGYVYLVVHPEDAQGIADTMGATK